MKLKELVTAIHACGYFDQSVEETSEEQTEEVWVSPFLQSSHHFLLYKNGCMHSKPCIESVPGLKMSLTYKIILI